MSEKTLAVLNDAAIRFDGRRLTMENNLVSRTIDFFRGYPETVSFRRIDLDREFADPEEPGCGVSFSGITPPGMYDVAFQLEGVTAKSVPAGSYETEFMGDGRKLSFPWRYSFSLNEIMYRYIGFGFILPYEATKQSSSINNCSIIPTESCWARS